MSAKMRKNCPENFFNALVELHHCARHLFPVVAAWWMFESNYGRSKLALEFNNFAGLKKRADVFKYLHYSYHDCFDTENQTYKDWDNRRDEYIRLIDPGAFHAVFFAFLSRTPYQGHGNSVVTAMFSNNPLALLAWAAECGFCGSISGVSKTAPEFQGDGYTREGAYRRAVHYEYVRRVLDVMRGERYKEIIRLIESDSSH